MQKTQRSSFVLLVASVLCFSSAAQAEERVKVLVDSSVTEFPALVVTEDSLAESETFPSFVELAAQESVTTLLQKEEGALYEIPISLLPSFLAQGAEVKYEYNYISLHREKIHYKDSTENIHRKLNIIQFKTPPSSEDLGNLKNTGSDILHYIPYNSYLIWNNSSNFDINNLKSDLENMQNAINFLPEYALDKNLDIYLNTEEIIDVTILLYNDKDIINNDLDFIKSIAIFMSQPADFAFEKFKFINVILTGINLMNILELETIVKIEPTEHPTSAGERQAAIMAQYQNSQFILTNPNDPSQGYFSGGEPQPGYLSWLANRGFSTNSNNYPIVAVVDTGVDVGRTQPERDDFYVSGNSANASRIIYSIWNDNVDHGTDNIPELLYPADNSGHGTLIASIISGFNNTNISRDYEDLDGFNYGLGISPYGRIGNQKHGNFQVIDNGSPGNYGTITYRTYANGARVSNNSWGQHGPGDPSSQYWGEYSFVASFQDLLVRDSQLQNTNTIPPLPDVPGSQQLTMVFAAGNSGILEQPLEGFTENALCTYPTPHAITVWSPGTAKNVITVGASENINLLNNLITTCFETAIGLSCICCNANPEANSAHDITFFSSRGPCVDGRVKPDIVAPGTWIQGNGPLCVDPQTTQTIYDPPTVLTAPAACETDENECNIEENCFQNFRCDGPYWPDDEPGDPLNFAPKTYTISSGTSFAAPAISGYCSLIWEFLHRVYSNSASVPVGSDFFPAGSEPSPALMKAYVVHSANWRTGQGTSANNITLPIGWNLGNFDPRNHQGYGMADMGFGFNAAAPRFFIDQSKLFTSSMQFHEYNGYVPKPYLPVRVVLAWTDLWALPNSNPALINDLDLFAYTASSTKFVFYRGNNFNSNRISQTGGSFDTLNNVEGIFLPNVLGETNPSFRFRVRGTSIVGDALLYHGASSQDYGLVVSNFIPYPTCSQDFGILQCGSSQIVSFSSSPDKVCTSPVIGRYHYRILIPGVDPATGPHYCCIKKIVIQGLAANPTCSGQPFPAVEFATNCAGPWTTHPNGYLYNPEVAETFIIYVRLTNTGTRTVTVTCPNA
jgi:hypothetical protein